MKLMPLPRVSKAQEKLLLKTAENILKTSLAVKPSEKFLVITDPETYSIGAAFFDAGLKIGAETVLTIIRERTRHGEEPPSLVAKAWEDTNVYIVPTKYSLTHTQARKAATQAGARGATMPSIALPMFRAGAITADYSKVRSLCEQMGALMDKAEQVRITSELGTDITMSIEGRMKERDTGILQQPGDFGNLPAGEVYCAPVEGTSNGTLVFDGSIASVGVLKKPVTVTVEQGFATNITGGSEAAKFSSLLAGVNRKEAYNVAELGVGCNPKAGITGIILEDEKIYGTVHVALGDNSTFGGNVQAGIHLDGIMRKPTMFLDGRTVIERGAWKI
jgi:leucyl aminopeptidase (aminopeptidase T)